MTKITTVIISPSCLRVVVLLMVMMIGPHNSASLEHKGVAMHKGAQGNLIFTENLLWSIVRPSVLSCAVTCVSDHNCVCFTVTKTASTGHTECRGHSVEPTGGGAESSGSRMYVLGTTAALTSPSTESGPSGASASGDDTTTTESDVTTIASELSSNWLYRNCVTNDDCPDVGETDCFRSKCVCYPGHYFSESADTCLETCAQSNLRSNFLEYPEKEIQGGSNLDTLDPVSLAACQTACVSYATCRSVDYDSDKLECFLFDRDANDDGVDFEYRDDDVSYYQRTCA